MTRKAPPARAALTLACLAAAACAGSTKETRVAGRAETAPQPPAAAAAPKQAAPPPAKLAANVRADFEAAVKKWETARQKGPIGERDCRSLADNFRDIKEPQLLAQAHFNAGTILEGCGREKDAESEYQAALQANPGYSPALNNLGQIYYKQNNPTTARSWFEKAIAADKTHNAPAYNNLAAIQFQQFKQSGDHALLNEAVLNLRRALAIDAYSMPAYSLLAVIYYTTAGNDLLKLSLAELVCNEAKKADDKFAPIYNTAGLVMLRRNDVTGAQRQFEQAVQLDPKYIEAYLNIGAIGLSTRQYEKAAQAFDAVLALDNKNLDATVGRGVAARGLKHFDEAEKWYKRVAELDPRNCAVQYNLGVLYQDYKTDPSNSNLNVARDYLDKYRGCGSTDPKKVQDAERRIKDIADMFAALEQQKKMEAELKAQQEEIERQQKAAGSAPQSQASGGGDKAAAEKAAK